MAAEYINRKDVLNDIAELFTICHETLPDEFGHHYVIEHDLETHWDFVRNLPAADVAPVRRGRWERKQDPYGFFGTIPVCSVCNCTTKLREEYLYCPNCGAYMTGGEQE